MARIRHTFSKRRGNRSTNKKKSCDPISPSKTKTKTTTTTPKKRRRRSGSLARKQAVKYGKSTNLLLNKTSIKRLIRNRISEHNKIITSDGQEECCIKDMRLSQDAVIALHTSTEDFLQKLVTGSVNNIKHFKKKKLRVIDLDHQYRMQFPQIYGGMGGGAGATSNRRNTLNSTKGRKIIILGKNNKKSSRKKHKSNLKDKQPEPEPEPEPEEETRETSSDSEHTPTPWQEIVDEIQAPQFV